ncbi:MULTISPECIES: protein kinase family protein [Microbacterium]|uniref:protein kinase family protein n=1 Tax=Microbacterium TaxID=33882 RepID=UPI000E747C26|nr:MULTISPECIES: protein kinase family protein [Microbacterium]MDQ1216729.1 tRNA A-37 threonylcarbamoyl transferase component Bud32 [Microbacterium arborescens]RKE63644.1 serine/threonine protein kinase [Microbacterium sp. AG238]
MADIKQVMDTLAADFDIDDAAPEYERLYANEEPPLNGVFAIIHAELNRHFRFMNTKIRAGRHFNADPSRELIDLIGELNGVRRALKRVGMSLVVRDDYQRTIEACNHFLVPSGGSTIPDWMNEIDIERFEPVLSVADRAPQRAGAVAPDLVLVGEGSFAFVHKFVDPLYGITFAVKRAKNSVSERDLERFRKEFELLSSIRFPYVVEAYQYDPDRNSFTMEYCDETLNTYIRRTNAELPWASRKRIALQFLYGLNFLHARGILHRDISRNNVLVKHFDSGAVLVKLSDFGLHKGDKSDFTRTDTELKGTILDPTLESFKDFAVVNDIYAAGAIISYIFSGRQALGGCEGDVEVIVQKATHARPNARYATVLAMIQDIESLRPPTGESLTPAEAPA